MHGVHTGPTLVISENVPDGQSTHVEPSQYLLSVYEQQLPLPDGVEVQSVDPSL